MTFFTQYNLDTVCQFYSNTSPVLFAIEWEKRRFFAYMYDYFSVSRYIKGGKKSQLLTVEFLDTHVI